MDQIASFERRLAETMAWCTAQDWAANPAERLRTALLRPEPRESGNEKVDWSQVPHWRQTPQQKQQLVEQLAIKRAKLLQERGISALQLVSPLAGGRLLVFDPAGTLREGAANGASGGFFDDSNIPAWDTWIAYLTGDPVSNPPWSQFDSYLLSWVPELLVDVVTASIEVTWEGCLLWATDLDSSFMRQLLQAGLVW